MELIGQIKVAMITTLTRFIYSTSTNIFTRIAHNIFDLYAGKQSRGLPRRTRTIITFRIIKYFFYFSSYAKFGRFVNDKKTNAQNYQDLFALYKSTGVKIFIEVGAFDGVSNSNTLLLENMGWGGALVEPNKELISTIADNRKSKIIEACVFNKTLSGGGYVKFSVKNQPSLSSIDGFGAHITEVKSTYLVKVITLEEIFRQLQTTVVDYISIDTEGSEYEILKEFDFYTYRINAFTIEHNQEISKIVKLDLLLRKHGFRRILTFLPFNELFYVNKNF